jgi:Polyketide cyclase / dehydrase and lipid transport
MITETILVNRNLSSVYMAFADLDNWMKVLPDVLDVKVLYDDGHHQEFLMTVDRPAGAETVRGIRFCLPSERIELFQPTPPPVFSRMVGIWTFKEIEEVTEVTAERCFDLKDRTGSVDVAEENLRSYLRKNLDLFKVSLEKENATFT